MSYIRDSKPMQGNESETKPKKPKDDTGFIVEESGESETRAQKLKRITGFSVEESDDILAFLKYLIKLCPAEHWSLYLKLCEGFIYADIYVRSLKYYALSQRNVDKYSGFEIVLTSLLPGFKVRMYVVYQTNGNVIVDIRGDVSIEGGDEQNISVNKSMKKCDCIKLLQLFMVPLKYDGIDKLIKE